MAFIMLPGGDDEAIIGQKTLREKLRIDVMPQLKPSVLKAHGCPDDSGMKLSALAVGERNAGTVLRVAMAVTPFGKGGGQGTWKMR